MRGREGRGGGGVFTREQAEQRGLCVLGGVRREGGREGGGGEGGVQGVFCSVHGPDCIPAV